MSHREPPAPTATEGNAPFPVGALPEPLRSMVTHAARHTSAPVSLCAAAGLGAVAASIGSGLFVQSAPARLTPGNLFLLLFADSGTGKGLAFGTMQGACNAEADRRSDEWQRTVWPGLATDLEAAKMDLETAKRNHRSARELEAKATAREAIHDANRRIREAETELARAPVFNVGNATLEGTAEKLAHAPGEAVAMLSAEARDVVDNLLGRYSKNGGGSDESIFLQGYSGDQVTVTRKGSAQIQLRAPRLTLCIAAQPDTWKRLAADGRMMESGFLARALAFDAKAPPARRSGDTIPTVVEEAWSARIIELMGLRESPDPRRIVNPSPAARGIIDALEDEAADARDTGGKWHGVKSFAARLAENAWRLALCLHAVQHGSAAEHHKLSHDTAAAAVTLARWFFAETLALLAPAKAKRQTARLERLLEVFRRKGTQELPLWELLNNHGFPESELESLATAFPLQFRITIGKPGAQGGRVPRTGQVAPFPA